jgi:L,D-transpeptidase ErfK/SrfK
LDFGLPMKDIITFFITVLTLLIMTGCTPGRQPLTLTERNEHLWPGENGRHSISAGETLVKLAVDAGVGYQSLLNANPGIDPWLPPEGYEVILPYAALLPSQLQKGITINLAEYRLFYLAGEEEKALPRIYPIGIAEEQSTTPEGDFAIRNKIKNPVWKVPGAVRRERRLPATLPPGPDNPLGEFWLGFSKTGHGIHGTNDPFGIGRRASRGCIRLYPQDIRDLFGRVQVGTPVRIVYQPIKIAVVAGELLAEVHPDFLARLDDPHQELLRMITTLEWQGGIDQEALTRVLREERGIPVRISPSPQRSPWRLGSSPRAKGG